MLFTIAAALFRNSLANVESLSMGQANGWQIMSFAASWGMQLAGLLILILSINLVTEEFSDRTIKNILSRPVTRTQFILGKTLTIGFLVLIFFNSHFYHKFFCRAKPRRHGASSGTRLCNCKMENCWEFNCCFFSQHCYSFGHWNFWRLHLNTFTQIRRCHWREHLPLFCSEHLCPVR